jgi:hypothetical protein
MRATEHSRQRLHRVVPALLACVLNVLFLLPWPQHGTMPFCVVKLRAELGAGQANAAGGSILEH